MKKLMEVEIFGQTFTVTSEDDEQYVNELAAHVDQRMRQIADSARTSVPVRVAMMAALSIADDCFKATRQEEELRKEADALATRLLHRIEETAPLGDAQNGPSLRDTASAVTTGGTDH